MAASKARVIASYPGAGLVDAFVTNQAGRRLTDVLDLDPNHPQKLQKTVVLQTAQQTILNLVAKSDRPGQTGH